MEPINLLLFIFFGIDMIFTYVNVNKFRKKFPKKDYVKMELNPITKYMWENFGLKLGGFLSIILGLFILTMFIWKMDHSFRLILIGIYIVVLMTHLSNFSILRKKKKKKDRKKIMKVLLIILLLLSFTDLCLTYNYVSDYKEWQPDRPYEDMESNPLLTFLWNNLGLTIGTLVGMIIIFSLIYLVGKMGNLFVIIALACALTFAIIINTINTIHLYELMRLYP